MTCITELIHPKCEIEEYLKIFRKDVWFKPLIAPVRADVKAKNIKIEGLYNIDKIIKGEIFCHVSKITELIQLKPSIVSGNQKWKGAIPSFIPKAIVIMSLGINVIMFPEKRINIKEE